MSIIVCVFYSLSPLYSSLGFGMMRKTLGKTYEVVTHAILNQINFN